MVSTLVPKARDSEHALRRQPRSKPSRVAAAGSCARIRAGRAGRFAGSQQRVQAELALKPAGANVLEPYGAASTSISPIIPPSACSRMWQWYIHPPGSSNLATNLSDDLWGTITVSLFASRSAGVATSPAAST
jgi:hypothetical protein